MLPLPLTEVEMLISEFANAIGVSRADVENWIYRLELSTDYAETTPGKARNYSRANVLELAFLAAMIKTGWPPRKAVGIVRDVLQDSWSIAAWLGWPAGKFDEATGASSLEALNVARLAKQSPYAAVSLIHVEKIVATVDALFAEKGEQ